MTSKTHEVVIADTSCLIVLHNSGLLHLLKSLYQSIIVTPEIANEFGLELPNWIATRNVPDSKFKTLLNSLVDRGEASAIALAMQLETDVLLILDDN